MSFSGERERERGGRGRGGGGKKLEESRGERESELD